MRQALTFLAAFCFGIFLHRGIISPTPQSVIPEPSRSSFAIVLPVSPRDAERLVQSMAKWPADACQASREPYRADRFIHNAPGIDLIVYYPYERALSSMTLSDISVQATLFQPCFRKVEMLSASLPPELDGYPKGPNEMFYRLLIEDEARLRGHYEAVFWMETDTRPVKTGWVDRLHEEMQRTAEEGLWMSGSHYRGRAYEKSTRLSDPSHQADIDHINGNAIYRVGDPEFIKFLSFVRTDCVGPEANPDWNPFDVCIWQTLHHPSRGSAVYKAQAHRFKHINLIHNLGHTITPEERIIASRSPEVVFIHGMKGSAGHSYWDPCVDFDESACGENAQCGLSQDKQGHPKAVCVCKEGFATLDGHTCDVRLD